MKIKIKKKLKLTFLYAPQSFRYGHIKICRLYSLHTAVSNTNNNCGTSNQIQRFIPWSKAQPLPLTYSHCLPYIYLSLFQEIILINPLLIHHPLSAILEFSLLARSQKQWTLIHRSFHSLLLYYQSLPTSQTPTYTQYHWLHCIITSYSQEPSHVPLCTVVL